MIEDVSQQHVVDDKCLLKKLVHVQYLKLKLQLLSTTMQQKKGSLVHVAFACARYGKGSNHFGFYVCSLSMHFCKRLFPGLESMTSWSQDKLYCCARATMQQFAIKNTYEKHRNCDLLSSEINMRTRGFYSIRQKVH
jgi:hypothetical protein